MLLVSFCTTSLNRNDQIMVTLPQNLKDNVEDRAWVEFIVVDFNQDDTLEKWMTNGNFDHYLNDGYLKYYHTKALVSWHASIAKNTAHALGSGNILVNLDGDNFVGVSGAQFVSKQFLNTPVGLDENVKSIVFHQHDRSKRGSGTYGRIACRREDFIRVGGYLEWLAPMSYQDADLVKRLERLTSQPALCDGQSEYTWAIKNSKDRSIANCTDKTYKEWTYREMLGQNRRIFQLLNRNKCVVANVGATHIGVDPASILTFDPILKTMEHVSVEPIIPQSGGNNVCSRFRLMATTLPRFKNSNYRTERLQRLQQYKIYKAENKQ